MSRIFFDVNYFNKHRQCCELKIMNRLQLNALIQYRTLLTHATCILSPKTPVNLSFKVVGTNTSDREAPPIFLLHGLLGNKKIWKGIGKTINHLMKQTVIVVDVRNHGGSPHICSNKYDEMALDMIQLLDKLSIEKASLVGFDIGGRMAMCTALMAVSKSF